eukprot:6212248-Pleurochrysis_carterae.AAC.2
MPAFALWLLLWKHARCTSFKLCIYGRSRTYGISIATDERRLTNRRYWMANVSSVCFVHQRQCRSCTGQQEQLASYK